MAKLLIGPLNTSSSTPAFGVVPGTLCCPWCRFIAWAFLFASHSLCASLDIFWKIGCEWMHQILIFWWRRFLGVLYFLYQKENMEMQVNFVDHWSEDVEKFLFIENRQRINQLINACGWNSTYVTSLVVGNPTMWLEIHPATIYSKK